MYKCDRMLPFFISSKTKGLIMEFPSKYTLTMKGGFTHQNRILGWALIN